MDSKILDRVRALLAKAAATDYPDEAEAFYAKASELMAKHNIDNAMLAARYQHRIDTSTSHAKYRTRLWWAICAAYGLTGIAITSKQWVIVDTFGAEDDIEAARLLYPQLDAHMTASLARFKIPTRHSKWDDRWDDDRTAAAKKAAHVRAHREAFLLAYVARIGQRLSEAHARAAADAEDSTPGVAVMLADQRSAGRKAADEAHPDARPAAAPSLKDRPKSALVAGWDAAANATVGQHEMPTGPRALGAGR